jgi:glycosyltransferase involved in cell wall biosynthesis
MKTVAHLISPISFGGGESLLFNLLCERRPDIREIVISVSLSDIFNQHLDAAGIEHFELNSKTLGHGISKTAMLLRTPLILFQIVKLFFLLRRERVDVLHAHGYPASILGALANHLYPMLTIYTHHFYRAKPSFIERLLLGASYQAYAVCTGVSKVVTESMQRAFPNVAQRFITIHNCVGNDFFNPQNHPDFALLSNSDRALFVQIARFSSFKNQMLVVESLGRLTDVERSRIRIIFVGDGIERPAVMARARELGLAEEVRFLGFVPYTLLPGLLAYADFGLFPSANEGFGIGAAECLAAGLPVLTLDTELMKEVVGDAGLQLAREDFHKGFEMMLKQGTFLRQKATERAKRYLPAVIKKQYLTIYLQNADSA